MKKRIEKRNGEGIISVLWGIHSQNKVIRIDAVSRISDRVFTFY